MALNTQWKWVDGLALKIYNNVMIRLAGWNPNVGVFPTLNSTNEIWTSVDFGFTWVKQGIAPWIPRHRNGFEIHGTKLYVWGGDPFDVPAPPIDMWVYDLALSGTGAGLVNPLNWTELTDDWGTAGGNRMGFASWINANGKPCMAGGQGNFGGTPPMFTDVVEYNFTTNEFDIIGTLPIANFCTGSATVDPATGHIYLIGGCRYTDVGKDNFNDKLLRSTNGGATFSIIDTLPPEMDGLAYCDSAWFDGQLWFLNGVRNAANLQGLWRRTSNGVWVQISVKPLGRHASALFPTPTALYCASGNTVNDVFKVTKRII